MGQGIAKGRRGWVLVATVAAMAGIVGAAALLWLSGGQAVKAETVREYTLEIMPKDLDLGDGAVWHAWTFNGTVPGPTLRVAAGETLRVRVINHLGMTASFHAHMDGYQIESDGSQANVILGRGADGILAPGGEYVYEFRPPAPGLFYYHTHSADMGLQPSQFVRQGLYGAIVVADPKEPPMREEVLFLGEMGHLTEGKVAPFVMNGMGVPGGEMALERIFKEQGLAGVTGLIDRTLPTFRVKVDEPLKLHVINIGDIEHSLYIHSGTYVSLGVLGGRPWPGKVVPLVQGAADTLLLRFTTPGYWLFHCHVESHADAGMVGLFIAE